MLIIRGRSSTSAVFLSACLLLRIFAIRHRALTTHHFTFHDIIVPSLSLSVSVPAPVPRLPPPPLFIRLSGVDRFTNRKKPVAKQRVLNVSAMFVAFLLYAYVRGQSGFHTFRRFTSIDAVQSVGPKISPSFGTAYAVRAANAKSDSTTGPILSLVFWRL